MRDLLERLLEEGIKGNALQIAEIWAEEHLPVVVFELDPSRAEYARSFGWDGSTSVFQISTDARDRLVGRLRSLSENRVAQFYADAHLAPVEFTQEGRPVVCYLIALVAKGLVFIKWDPAAGGYSIELGGITGDELS